MKASHTAQVDGCEDGMPHVPEKPASHVSLSGKPGHREAPCHGSPGQSPCPADLQRCLHQTELSCSCCFRTSSADLESMQGVS